MTGADDRKRETCPLSVDFKGLFVAASRPFVAAFVAVVKLLAGDAQMMLEAHVIAIADCSKTGRTPAGPEPDRHAHR